MFTIKYFKKDEIVFETMPKWLDPEDYKKNKSKYIIAWTLGVPLNISCERIMMLQPKQVYVIGQLLKTKKFKSNYRKSLRSRLDAWLEDVDSDYFSPFSNKQWETVINDHVIRNTVRLIQNLHRLVMDKDE